jgi:hypothetical protein
MNFRNMTIVCLTCVMLLAPIARADVKTEERTKIELPGLLGGFMKTFGGKAAREGVVSKVALKGNRKMSVNEDTATLVDLSEEKIYQIDMKKKTYTVLTFEQMRRQMQEAMDKAKAELAKNRPPQPTTSDQQPQFDVDFKLQESGQKSTISGYECREVVATMNVHSKDKNSGDEGAMVVTVNMWLAPRIAALKELEEFDLRVAQKLYLPVAQEMAATMASALATYPGLKDAMSRLQTEKVNMDGVALRTVFHGDFVVNPNQPAPTAKPAEQNKQPEIPRSLGGLLGGLGKKTAARNDENTNKDKPGSFMTSTTEMTSISTTVSDADVSIPAGFKEQK